MNVVRFIANLVDVPIAGRVLEAKSGRQPLPGTLDREGSPLREVRVGQRVGVGDGNFDLMLAVGQIAGRNQRLETGLQQGVVRVDFGNVLTGQRSPSFVRVPAVHRDDYGGGGFCIGRIEGPAECRALHPAAPLRHRSHCDRHRSS